MHPEALTKPAAKLFPDLSRFGHDYYLAGGTALALQIGHRVSVDFDMFSNNELPKTLLAKVKRVYQPSLVIPSINNPEQLNVTIEGVKLTFLWYRYPPIMPFEKYQGVNLVSVPAIAAMKAFAIGQRGTFRDYVDMYFLLKEEHVTIKQIFELADRIFLGEFNQRLFLEQLIYLDDVKDMPVDFLRDPVSRDVIRLFFEEQIKNFKL